MPVLPDVGSISVAPTRNRPLRSASSTIERAMRSFTLPAGLPPSSLPRTSRPHSSDSLRSRSSGVSPIKSLMLSTSATLLKCGCRAARGKRFGAHNAQFEAESRLTRPSRPARTPRGHHPLRGPGEACAYCGPAPPARPISAARTPGKLSRRRLAPAPVRLAFHLACHHRGRLGAHEWSLDPLWMPDRGGSPRRGSPAEAPHRSGTRGALWASS